MDRRRRFTTVAAAVAAVLSVIFGPAAPSFATNPSWHVQTVPSVRSASAGGVSGLQGVACPSASECIAVGSYDTTASVDFGNVVYRPWAQEWNGSSWTIQTVPEPAGTSVATLAAVDCASPTSCLAVGNGKVNGKVRPVTARWDGTTWTSKVQSLPTGATTGSLDAVSCTFAFVCTAVGRYTKAQSTYALVMRLGQGAWTFQTAVASYLPGGLTGVSCPGTKWCVAVARDEWVGRWNGTSWSELALPPTGSNIHHLIERELGGVSCPTVRHCVVVGGYIEGTPPISDPERRVSEVLANGEWTQTILPAVGSTSTKFGVVSCVSMTDCTATGDSFYVNQEGYPAPASGLVDTWDGATWTASTTSSGGDFTGEPPNLLTGISCPASGTCLVVGAAQLWRNGGTWKGTKPRHPAVITEDPLTAVSCGSTTSCLAVGYYYGSTRRPFAEAWGAHGWRFTAVPIPAHTTLNDVDLSAVSCSSATACLVVGDRDVNGGATPASWSWNGTSLRVTAAPPLPAHSQDGSLDAVSCVSAKHCLAIGSYETEHNDVITLHNIAEIWNGSHWHAVASPKGSQVRLSAVSCVGTKFCAAVGSAGAGGAGETLRSAAETWDGSAWTKENVPLPDKYVEAPLNAVSCVSAKRCAAVGNWSESMHAGPTYALIDSWNGSHWKMAKTVFSTEDRTLTGVSCPSTSSCVAVGWHEKSGSHSTRSFSEVLGSHGWATKTVAAPDGPGRAELMGVSCAKRNVCTAVGDFDSAVDGALAERY